MILKNSSSEISPSPSRSASSIISANVSPDIHMNNNKPWISSSVMFSPSSLATRFKFLKLILPVSSSVMLQICIKPMHNTIKQAESLQDFFPRISLALTESEPIASQYYTIFAVISSKNSLKSMVPEPSYYCEFIGNLSADATLSISAIIFLISSFFGSKPKARMATFSSFTSIVPDPSVSNRSNASRISCFL